MTEFFDVRMRGFRDRADLNEAIALVLRRIAPLSVETVPLHEAAGRALAREAVAICSVPGFDRAAMDGYALRARDVAAAGPGNRHALAIVGVAMPGKPFSGAVAAGQAVRIMTGAPIPTGADAVLRAEKGAEGAGTLQVEEAVLPGRDVSRTGEDVAAGTVILPAGRVLRPQDLGLLASAGLGSVFVHRVPKVSILVTGDELLPVGSKPAGCQIVDSNSIMLASLIRRDGGEPDISAIVPDRRDAVRESLLSVDGDLILVSGGSSVGQEDHAPAIVAEDGELLIHGVALRPAGPTGFGDLRGRPVFLLPGNPVSCLVGYDLLAGRALRRMVGKSPDLPYFRLHAPLAVAITSVTGRVDCVRVTLHEGQVRPVSVSGASILSTTTTADGFVLVPRDCEGWAAGERVEVHLYGGPPQATGLRP